MNIQRILAIALRQFYLMKSSPSRFVHLFIWVAVDMLLWGFMTRYLNMLTGGGNSFVPALLGAVLLWDMTVRVMQGVTMTYMEDSWSRNLVNIFASPMSMGEYTSGLVLSSLMTSTIGLAVMLFLAIGVFGLSFFSYGVALFPFLLIIFMTGIALGIFGCALMMRLGPSAEWFVWPIPAILSPFAAVYYPKSTLPEWMQQVGAIVPPSYVFENVRAIVHGQIVSWQGLVTGLALAFAYIVLACLFFIATHRRAMRTGSIARFGAENY
jgi:ABC-2 type transport system permease protein